MSGNKEFNQVLQVLQGVSWYHGVDEKKKKSRPFDFYIGFGLEAVEETALYVPIFILESLFWL